MRLASALPALLLCSATATAAAAPSLGPTLSGEVPTLAVPCIPAAGVELLAAEWTRATLCWDDACLAFEVDGLGAKFVPRPTAPPPPAWPDAAEIRAQGSGLAACRGATCRRVGPRLAAAIGRWRAEAHEGQGPMSVTSDLTAVLLPPTSAWRIGSDSKLVFKTPRGYLKSNVDRPELVELEVAGDLLISSWVKYFRDDLSISYERIVPMCTTP